MPVPTEALETHPSDPVMGAIVQNARRVVEAAKDRDARLRVDPDSLAVLDRCLEEGWLGDTDDPDDAVTCIGCFLGQVLVEAEDGVWAQDPDRGLHVRVGDVCISPFAWVHGRLTRDEPPLIDRFRDLDRRLGDGFRPAR